MRGAAAVLLLMATAGALYFTLFNWWVATTPVLHPEVYQNRGLVFFIISGLLAAITIIWLWSHFRKQPAARL
jgi:uncharacterized membrane protein